MFQVEFEHLCRLPTYTPNNIPCLILQKCSAAPLNFFVSQYEFEKNLACSLTDCAQYCDQELTQKIIWLSARIQIEFC